MIRGAEEASREPGTPSRAHWGPAGKEGRIPKREAVKNAARRKKRKRAQSPRYIKEERRGHAT